MIYVYGCISNPSNEFKSLHYFLHFCNKNSVSVISLLLAQFAIQFNVSKLFLIFVVLLLLYHSLNRLTYN